jgi:hypothetical protein
MRQGLGVAAYGDRLQSCSIARISGLTLAVTLLTFPRSAWRATALELRFDFSLHGQWPVATVRALPSCLLPPPAQLVLERSHTVITTTTTSTRRIAFIKDVEQA